jgi:hypothetical protein
MRKEVRNSVSKQVSDEKVGMNSIEERVREEQAMNHIGDRRKGGGGDERY